MAQAAETRKWPWPFWRRSSAPPHLFENVCFLAASTDGNDGPTDAAGAFADLEMLVRAEQADLSPADYLAANDSYHFFTAINGLLKTGPTNTNVCDLQMILIDP
jgi:glycerate 2-kinase